MTHLEELENKSIYIIREAYYKYKNIALLWSIGKDSTSLLWMCYKAFLGKIPFPVLHIDTGFKFKEIYQFRDQYAKEWNLDLIVTRNEEALARGVNCHDSKLICCTELKTNALKQAIEKYHLQALLLGIRRDEHGIRAKERYFSPRDENFQWDYKNQPAELWEQFKSRSEGESHYRVHPLLHMTELDIWKYIRQERLPVVDLYFSKNGKRYRSIGCEPACTAIESKAQSIDDIIEEIEHTKEAERAGRAQDKEDMYTMQKLRALGYM